MKAVFIDLKHNSESSLYTQLFEYLRDSIIDGSIKAGERLPSLRDLAKQLSVSITTCARAYDQLVLEGYVEVRPQSGYYVQALEQTRQAHLCRPTRGMTGQTIIYMSKKKHNTGMTWRALISINGRNVSPGS